jgi:hypothetical protein
MTAGFHPITIEQGANVVIPLIIWTVLNVPPPVDLTGYTAAMMIRQNINDPNPVISLSSPSNGIVLGGTAGTITITISPSMTSPLNPGMYVYDLKIIDSNGNPQRLLQGPVTVSAAVTR